MTHTNMGTSKCHHKICDKHYLLPWCKLQTRGHFLTEISFHHAVFFEKPRAGSAQMWLLPDHMASLCMAGHRKFHKSSGMHVLVLAQCGEVSQKHLQGQGCDEELSNIKKLLYLGPQQQTHNLFLYHLGNKIAWQLHQLMPHLFSLLHQQDHVHIFIFTLHFFQTNFCC